jgi:hypothetical protein
VMLLVAANLNDFGSASRLHVRQSHLTVFALLSVNSIAEHETPRTPHIHHPTLNTPNRDSTRLAHVHPARRARNTQTISAPSALVTARTSPPLPKPAESCPTYNTTTSDFDLPSLPIQHLYNPPNSNQQSWVKRCRSR